MITSSSKFSLGIWGIKNNTSGEIKGVLNQVTLSCPLQPPTSTPFSCRKLAIQEESRDFPGGPVVKPLPSTADVGLVPVKKIKIPYAVGYSQKVKQECPTRKCKVNSHWCKNPCVSPSFRNKQSANIEDTASQWVGQRYCLMSS